MFLRWSGNEIYCLAKKNFQPGDFVLGNSVYAMGFIGGLKSSFKGLVGGEITQYTDIILQGRKLAIGRLEKEVADHSGVGVSGMTSELIMHEGNIEFLSTGSTLHTDSDQAQNKFSCSSDGQELYCQIDSNYYPQQFVFGNVAYSIGLGRGMMGGIKLLARGEVVEYTQIFNQTRNLALERIVNEASTKGANAVVGIETKIIPFVGSGVQEMLMVGTASFNQQLKNLNLTGVVTSDLTSQELWNLTKMGYMPLKLMLGTSVYSLGFIGNVKAILKTFVKGEISELTELVYEAREKSLSKITDEAAKLNADDVVGVKTYVYGLGNGLIEFLAIGTAVKKVGGGVSTQTEDLIPQAIINDKDTFTNTSESQYGVNLSNSQI